MPIYEYRCEECSKEFEEVVSLTATSTSKYTLRCPNCNSATVKKIIKSPPTVTFVGKGFFINDNKKP